MAHHGKHVSGVPLDALNPYKALLASCFKIMYVHLTNVYDNLPFDDLVRRDGKLYLVEVRAYLNGALADGLTADFGLVATPICRGLVEQLLDGGPGRVFDGEQGVEFWRRVWDTFKLEERLRRARRSRRGCTCRPACKPHAPRGPAGRGARRCAVPHFARRGESFANTLPLLHPRGYPAGAGHLRQRRWTTIAKASRGPASSMARS